MRLFKPTKTRKCWLCIDDLYQGHGPTEGLAYLDMQVNKIKHLKAMAEEELATPKTVKE